MALKGAPYALMPINAKLASRELINFWKASAPIALMLTVYTARPPILVTVQAARCIMGLIRIILALGARIQPVGIAE